MRRYTLILFLVCLFMSGCANKPNEPKSSSTVEIEDESIEKKHEMNTSQLTDEEKKIAGYVYMKKENHPTYWVEFREDRTYWENKEQTSTKRWELQDNKLIINYYTLSGEYTGAIVYSYSYIDDTTFTLIYDDLQFEYTCTKVDKF